MLYTVAATIFRKWRKEKSTKPFFLIGFYFHRLLWTEAWFEKFNAMHFCLSKNSASTSIVSSLLFCALEHWLSLSCSSVLGACNTVYFWEVDCNINLCIEYVWSGVYFDINSKHSFIANCIHTKNIKCDVGTTSNPGEERERAKVECALRSCRSYHMKAPSPTGIELWHKNFFSYSLESKWTLNKHKLDTDFY